MLSDDEKARALARFRSLRGRGVQLSFESFGPEVKADTPQELKDSADEALVQASQDSEDSN